MIDVSKVPRKVLDRWARDRKLQPLYWTLSILLLVCSVLLTSFTFAYDAACSEKESEPQQIAIGMDLETFKKRVNAYSVLRDNNIKLSGESFLYKDGYYSACYLLGGSANVTVHLTDEESQQIYDIEILALNETEEEITRYVVYLAAFNKALVDDECLNEIDAIADFMREFDINAGAKSIGDIELYTYFPKTSDGRLAGFAQVTYKRFAQEG